MERARKRTMRPEAIKSALIASALLFSGLAHPGTAAAAPECIECPQATATLGLPVAEWEDPERVSTGVVLAIHGLTLHARTFKALGEHLASRGYPVYALDLRGFGRWKEKQGQAAEPAKVDFRKSEKDVEDVLSTLRKSYPDKKLICLGESLGANIALHIASVEPDLVDGVIASAPCRKTYLHPRWRWIPDFLRGLLFPRRPSDMGPYVRDTISNDPAVVETYLGDPVITHRLSPVRLIKTRLANRRLLKELSRMPSSMPVLILSGKNDQLYKSAAVPEMVGEMGSKTVEMHILQGRGHLLLECHPHMDPLVESTIDRWMDRYGSTTMTARKPSAPRAVPSPEKHPRAFPQLSR